MKNFILIIIFVQIFIISFLSCKPSKIVKVNEKQTSQYDKKQEVTHVTTKRDLKIKSEEAVKLNDLGIKLGQQGDYIQARNKFLEALKIEGENAGIFGNLGLIELLSKNYEMAAHYFLKSIEVDPVNPSPYMNLGVNYNRSQKYEQAIEVFSGILENFSDSSLIGFVHLNMAESYFELKECDKARSSVEKGKEIIGEKAYEIASDLDKLEKSISKCLNE